MTDRVFLSYVAFKEVVSTVYWRGDLNNSIRGVLVVTSCKGDERCRPSC